MHFGKIPILISLQVNDGLIWDVFRPVHTSIVALQGDLEIDYTFMLYINKFIAVN